MNAHLAAVPGLLFKSDCVFFDGDDLRLSPGISVQDTERLSSMTL
ncbi:hypothetical protein [Pseudomonas graminis]|uniref:Uncharacterized protein n=1 Tax=Pseudomonas graminis TaxID=158627 RepID=A0A6M8MF87_9PSED|nr:hypothetical protein [Pseudomonas graminis]QKF53429.1 hypothetical protein FX982_04422 [Pseudomonas graminis]